MTMDKKLDEFVEELQKYYEKAHDDYMMSSMFSSGAAWQSVLLVEKIMQSLNKACETDYRLKKPRGYDL